MNCVIMQLLWFVFVMNNIICYDVKYCYLFYKILILHSLILYH